MTSAVPSNDLGRQLLDESGYRAFRPRFSDPEMETAFEASLWQRNNDTWNRGLKVILPLAVAMIFAHWLFAEDVSTAIRIVEIGLIAFMSFCYFIPSKRLPTAWRAEVTLVLTLLGQSACIALLAMARAPQSFIAAGYLAVIIGSIAPNRLTNQVVSAVLPAVAIVVLVFALNIFSGRFAVYQVGFSCLAAGMAISLGIQQSHASRIEFLLTLHANRSLARSDRLLANVLPQKIADRMKDMPAEGEALVESFADVTVLFADLVGFTTFAASRSADETVRTLSDVFRRFDAIAAQCGIEKIKTIGDAYMAVGGLPEPCADHTLRIVDAALEMREALKKYCALMGHDLELRIGIHRGPVIAGIIGTQKFLYDLWGATVNLASRLESHGLSGQVQVSEAVAASLADSHELTCRGVVEIKGMGPVTTFIVERPRLAAFRATA